VRRAVPRKPARTEPEDSIRILIVEDQVTDAELCERALRQAGLAFNSRRVDTRNAFESELDNFIPDIILSDFTLPGNFDGLLALDIARRKHPKIPFVFVSGTIGEERAVEAIKQGASDYVLKDRLARLGPAIRQVLEHTRLIEQKSRAEEAQRASEQRFRAIFDYAGIGISMRSAHDSKHQWMQVNDHFCKLLGYTRDELQKLGKEDVAPAEEQAKLLHDNERLLSGEVASYSREMQLIRKDGQRIWVLLTVATLPDSGGRPSNLIATYQDVSERKLQEQKIEKLSRVRTVTSEINTAIIHSHNRQGLLDEVCRIAVEHGKFGLAWSGTFDPTTMEVRPIAWAGAGTDDIMRHTTDVRPDTPQGRGNVGRAVRERKPVYSNEIEPGLGGKRLQEMRRLGHRSVIALPLHIEDTVTGVVVLFSTEPGFFTDEEVKLLNEVAGNISFALEHIERQQKLEKLSRIRSILGEINAAIVRIHDTRELLVEACRVATEAGGFPFAWIGLHDHSTSQVVPVSWGGTATGYLDTVEDPRPVGSAASPHPGLVASAVWEKTAVIVNDVRTDPRVARRSMHLERGTGSIAVLPLHASGEVTGVLALHARERGYFDEEEVSLLAELSGDIGFALQTIEKQKKLDFLSYYDPLTELPNRMLFIDRASQQMRSRGGESLMVAMILLNLERFRNINETFGRHGGDDLLKQVTQRLERAFNGKDLLARFGADGFGAVIRGVRDTAAALHIIQDQVLGCFREPFKVSGHELRVAAKAGIAMFPADGGNADTLFSNAEAALKQAKQSGERYLFYAADMNARAAHVLSLETRLRKAAEERQFVLHYQPKIDLARNVICGMEALIRWQDPGSGLIAPGTFIPILEETGLILEVGQWALGQALADHREWTARGCKAPRIAVNVSAVQLQQKNFAEIVIDTVQREGDNADALELEITESLLMKDVEACIRKLSILRGLGIQIAMDDFGTGYSSLSYITRLPINSLKIDRSFITGMADNPQDMAIVTTIIALAHSLNLQVVAEGVESGDQSQLLKLLKCDEAQGFLFSKPLPADEIETLLRRG
jgi:diguanylate cyclase (GGDEF)-like protein/PAS domain S-box-containing protein